MKKKLKYKNRYDIIFSYLAPMAELVDAADSKSASSNRVPVQVRMGAPYAEIAQLVEQLTCNQ